MVEKIKCTKEYNLWTIIEYILNQNKSKWMMGVVIGAIILEIKQISALCIEEI